MADQDNSTWYGSLWGGLESGVGNIWDSATGAVGSVFDEAGNAAGSVLDYGLPQWLDFGNQPSLTDRAEQFSGRYGPVPTNAAYGYGSGATSSGMGQYMPLLLIGGLGLAAVLLIEK